MLGSAKHKFLISFFLFVPEISESCKPLVQGETYVLRQVFRHTLLEDLELVWSRNTTPVSTCRRNMACYDYNADGTVTTLRPLGDDLFEATLTIKNVNKADAGTVKLKYLGLASLKHSQPLYTCKLQIYEFSVLTLQDCHEFVEEGSDIRCLCKKKDGISEDFALHWFDHNREVQNNGSHLLSFLARKDVFGYTCRALRSDGVESKPQEYRPIILSTLVLKDRKSVENFNIHQIFTFGFTDRTTYFYFTIILVMMSLIVVTIIVCFRKEKLCSKSGKRLRNDWTMRSSFQYVLLSPEDLKGRQVIPHSPLETISLSSVSLNLKEEFISLGH